MAGERNSINISAGGIDFDLGNSPREFAPEIVCGKTIVSTTTNGTRALRACVGAKTILASSFLNLNATAEFLRQNNFENILLVCAGTGGDAATEDIARGGRAGGFAFIRQKHTRKQIRHSIAARTAYVQAILTNLEKSLGASKNSQRLLAIPELRDDVAFCLQRDIFPLVAKMEADGTIRISI